MWKSCEMGVSEMADTESWVSSGTNAVFAPVLELVSWRSGASDERMWFQNIGRAFIRDPSPRQGPDPCNPESRRKWGDAPLSKAESQKMRRRRRGDLLEALDALVPGPGETFPPGETCSVKCYKSTTAAHDLLVPQETRATTGHESRQSLPDEPSKNF